MKKTVLAGVMVVLLLSAGCIPIDLPGDEKDQGWWSASVSYKLSAPVVETPVSGDPIYHEAWPLEVLIETGGRLTPDGEYRGDALAESWVSHIELRIGQTRDAVVSLAASRVKDYGLEKEWRREDEVHAQDIPLVPEESSEDYLVYRLTGSAACTAISYLHFHTHRQPTDAVPEDGPDYLIDDTGGDICDEDSYLEVVLAYQED